MKSKENRYIVWTQSGITSIAEVKEFICDQVGNLKKAVVNKPAMIMNYLVPSQDGKSNKINTEITPTFFKGQLTAGVADNISDLEFIIPLDAVTYSVFEAKEGTKIPLLDQYNTVKDI